MFILKDKTGTSTKGKPYFTFKLLTTHTDRLTGRTRRETILSLGAKFAFPEDKWPELCARIEELSLGSSRLLACPAEVEREARRLHALIMAKRRGRERGGTLLDGYVLEDFDTRKARTVGIEYLSLKGAQELGLQQIFSDLGYSKSQIDLFLALIVARMAEPGSERSTVKWLKNNSGLGFLLDVDFGPMTDMSLHRACDALLERKDRIEEEVYKRLPARGDFGATIALYDLTNTYFEGRPPHPDIRRGFSKEKRFDCPLVSLAVMLDWDGFIRKSMVFPGNVSEPATLGTMVGAMAPPKGTMFIMDRGIATAANVKFLRDGGFRYLVVNKEKARVFDEARAEPIRTAKGEDILIYSQRGEDGLENRVYCRSPSRAAKERAMLRGKMVKFEGRLDKLDASLKSAACNKDIGKVNRAIGSLRKEFAGVAHFYEVEILYAEKGEGPDGRAEATGIEYRERAPEGSKLTHPGVYCLKTNDLGLSAEEVWRTYIGLTKVEGVFRSLKSELGLRPVYHWKKERIDCHLFVSTLAYQCINMIRNKLTNKGINDSWMTIVKTLSTHMLSTIIANHPENDAIELKKVMLPEYEHVRIYNALNLPLKINKISKKIIKTAN
jgi:transposase